DVGVVVPGQPDEADLARALGLDRGLDRAAAAEHLLELVLLAEVVHLPEIEVIGLQAAEALVEERERLRLRALVRLRGEEHAIARARALGERLAVVVLARRVRGGGVAVLHALRERRLDHRDGLSRAPVR